MSVIRPSWKVYESLCKSRVRVGGANPPDDGFVRNPDNSIRMYTDPAKIALYDSAYQWGIAFNNLTVVPGDPGEVMDAWITAGTPDPSTGVPPNEPLLTERP